MRHHHFAAGTDEGPEEDFLTLQWKRPRLQDDKKTSGASEKYSRTRAKTSRQATAGTEERITVLLVRAGHDAEHLGPGDSEKEHSAQHQQNQLYITGVDDERNV